jgi:hypothetical protein
MCSTTSRGRSPSATGRPRGSSGGDRIPPSFSPLPSILFIFSLFCPYYLGGDGQNFFKKKEKSIAVMYRAAAREAHGRCGSRKNVPDVKPMRARIFTTSSNPVTLTCLFLFCANALPVQNMQNMCRNLFCPLAPIGDDRRHGATVRSSPAPDKQT